MYYLIDTTRRKIIVWRDTLEQLKQYMRKHDIGESEHIKIVQDLFEQKEK